MKSNVNVPKHLIVGLAKALAPHMRKAAAGMLSVVEADIKRENKTRGGGVEFSRSELKDGYFVAASTATSESVNLETVLYRLGREVEYQIDRELERWLKSRYKIERLKPKSQVPHPKRRKDD